MRSEIDIKVIRNVKTIRKKLNISQRLLGEIIGTSPNFVNQVESANSPCKYSVHQLYMIAKYFGCSVSELFPPIDPLEP